MKGSYEPIKLVILAELTERASRSTSGAATVSLEDLETQLLDIFDAVLGPQDGDFRDLWKDFGEHDLAHIDLAALFAEAAGASDPLAIVGLDSVAFTELRSSLRTRWASKSSGVAEPAKRLTATSWHQLSLPQQADVRDRIHNLERFHHSFVKRGAQYNAAINTILFELATLFVSRAKLNIHECDLPHAPKSRFIKFAALATEPFLPVGAVTPAGLSNRWKRQKQAHTTGSI